MSASLPIRRYGAALFCLCGLILCAASWERSNNFSDTFVMPLLPPWSVRFHSFCGRQVVQVIPEYNSLPKPLLPMLRLSYATHQMTPGDATYLRAATQDFRFQWHGQNYQLGFPCWFSVSVLSAAIILLLYLGKRIQARRAA